MRVATSHYRYHLDLGSGMDAEYCQARSPDSTIRWIAMDPLITSGMVTSGRLASLPEFVWRLGAEIRPTGSVEQGKQAAFLPLRTGSVAHVHCGFVLHLYLETLELLAAEVWRVLQPEGTLEVLLPHFADLHSERVLQRTQLELEKWFMEVKVMRYAGPFTTFWADLYQDRTYLISAVKG